MAPLAVVASREDRRLTELDYNDYLSNELNALQEATYSPTRTQTSIVRLKD